MEIIDLTGDEVKPGVVIKKEPGVKKEAKTKSRPGTKVLVRGYVVGAHTRSAPLKRKKQE